MKTRKTHGFLNAVFCAAILLALAGVALPHHSTANFDRTKEQTVTGTVTYFGFTNPHSFFDMEVVNAEGKTQPYKVFTAGRVLLVRYDWKASDMKAGDNVTVTGYPDRDDPRFLYLSRIEFASGKVWERGQIPD